MQVLTDYLARLDTRERLVLLVGGFMGAILLLWALGVAPMMEDADKLERLTVRKQRASVELEKVLSEYRAQAARVGNAVLAAPDSNFSLLSFLEGLSDRARVKGNIKYMRPSTTDVADGIREHSVEIKVANIRLAAMVELITQVERSPHALRIKRLHVKRRFSDASLLDVTFVVSRYEAS